MFAMAISELMSVSRQDIIRKLFYITSWVVFGQTILIIYSKPPCTQPAMVCALLFGGGICQMDQAAEWQKELNNRMRKLRARERERERLKGIESETDRRSYMGRYIVA